MTGSLMLNGAFINAFVSNPILNFDKLNFGCPVSSSTVAHLSISDSTSPNDKCSFISGPNSTIVSLIISGNDNAKALEKELYEHGFFVKAILSPTVAKGSERLRICIHDFNTKSQLSTLAELINKLI